MIGRAILSAGAAVLFVVGVSGLFGADELARVFLRGAGAGEPLIHIAAGGLLGFAMVNWMSRGNRIGGIYMRPLAIGNLLLFTVSGLSLARALMAGQLPPLATALALAFSALAVAFGWLAFAHDPLASRNSSGER